MVRGVVKINPSSLFVPTCRQFFFSYAASSTLYTGGSVGDKVLARLTSKLRLLETLHWSVGHPSEFLTSVASRLASLFLAFLSVFYKLYTMANYKSCSRYRPLLVNLIQTSAGTG